MIIGREVTFQAAHRLPLVSADHKCSRMHGHSYRVRVEVEGPVTQARGWVCDFAELDAVLRTLLGVLDHQTLNDIDGLSNPTSEMLALWLWERVAYQFKALRLHSVEVHEGGASWCRYEGK